MASSKFIYWTSKKIVIELMFSSTDSFESFNRISSRLASEDVSSFFPSIGMSYGFSYNQYPNPE